MNLKTLCLTRNNQTQNKKIPKQKTLERMKSKNSKNQKILSFFDGNIF